MLFNEVLGVIIISNGGGSDIPLDHFSSSGMKALAYILYSHGLRSDCLVVTYRAALKTHTATKTPKMFSQYLSHSLTTRQTFPSSLNKVISNNKHLHPFEPRNSILLNKGCMYNLHTHLKCYLVNFEIPNGFLYYRNDFGISKVTRLHFK